jgi:uncharacterized protein YdhG (YjbR/CyaY superfamily)
MVSSKETTPAAYIASLTAEQRIVIEAVRAVVKKRLPKGYVETMNWGMLSYEIPLSTYPDTYNKQPLMYLALAAQKGKYALYTTTVRSNPPMLAKLTAAYKASGKKLDMGGGCIRFKTLADLPLDVVGEIVAATSVADRIAASEAGRTASAAARNVAKPVAKSATKPVAKSGAKPAAKQAAKSGTASAAKPAAKSAAKSARPAKKK